MIEFRCRKCDGVVRAPESQVGRKGRCPACQDVFPIPEKSERLEPVEFPCEMCGHHMKASGKFVGKQGQCPRCEHRMTIPAESVPSEIVELVAVKPKAAPTPKPVARKAQPARPAGAVTPTSEPFAGLENFAAPSSLQLPSPASYRGGPPVTGPLPWKGDPAGRASNVLGLVGVAMICIGCALGWLPLAPEILYFGAFPVGIAGIATGFFGTTNERVAGIVMSVIVVMIVTLEVVLLGVAVAVIRANP